MIMLALSWAIVLADYAFAIQTGTALHAFSGWLGLGRFGLRLLHNCQVHLDDESLQAFEEHWMLSHVHVATVLNPQGLHPVFAPTMHLDCVRKIRYIVILAVDDQHGTLDLV